MGAMSTKLFSRLFGRSEIRIALVGLDCAGKTTILYKLKLGEVVEEIPTIGFNIETVEFKNVSFVVWDISIKDKVLVFVVDSNCRDRILEAKDMLHSMLNSEELQDKILLVLANKQDLPSAMNVIEITEKLDLYSLKQRLWYVQTTCGTSGAGLHEGLDWLSRNIDN